MTETPKYTVIRKEKNIELRQYAAYINAKVSVAGPDYRSAIYQGFNILAGYIFGNNIARQKIDMTTPVQVAQSQKIAMTTPVTVTGDGSFTVAFSMPAQYTLETLPLPKDEGIQFSRIPGQRMAVIRFTGHFRQENIEKHRQQLAAWLQAQDLEMEGEVLAAAYDPPWVPWFMTRNEVMVKVKDPASPQAQENQATTYSS